MKQKDRSRLFVRLLCWILAGLMVIGGATTLIYAMLGLL